MVAVRETSLMFVGTKRKDFRKDVKMTAGAHFIKGTRQLHLVCLITEGIRERRGGGRVPGLLETVLSTQ